MAKRDKLTPLPIDTLVVIWILACAQANHVALLCKHKQPIRRRAHLAKWVRLLIGWIGIDTRWRFLPENCKSFISCAEKRRNSPLCSVLSGRQLLMESLSIIIKWGEERSSSRWMDLLVSGMEGNFSDTSPPIHSGKEIHLLSLRNPIAHHGKILLYLYIVLLITLGVFTIKVYTFAKIKFG